MSSALAYIISIEDPVRKSGRRTEPCIDTSRPSAFILEESVIIHDPVESLIILLVLTDESLHQSLSDYPESKDGFKPHTLNSDALMLDSTAAAKRLSITETDMQGGRNTSSANCL